MNMAKDFARRKFVDEQMLLSKSGDWEFVLREFALSSATMNLVREFVLKESVDREFVLSEFALSSATLNMVREFVFREFVFKERGRERKRER